MRIPWKLSAVQPVGLTFTLQSTGKATLTVKWSSPHYDYMIVDGEKYEPVNKDELASADEDSGIGSIFEIPVTVMNEPFTVIADTTAMSEPHEIEYKLTLTLVKD